MLKWLLLLITPFYLYALEIAFQAGKEDFEKYTVLHVREKSPFICEPQFDNFNNINKVICAFSKRPEDLFKPLNDDFFNVVSEMKKDTFFLIITPIYQMKLIPDVFDLSKDTTIFKSDVKLSKSWVMVGYKDKFPLLKEVKTPDTGLNLPITFTNDDLLYVGSLDIQGNPVHIKQARDVTAYLDAKKKYEAKDYSKVLNIIDEIIKSYPDSIFMSELLYYKIKSLEKLGEHEEVVSLSKSYLRNYSSDENVPEILSLTARAYSKMSLNSDADYFYDRLFSEHSDSVFSKKGMIYKADQLVDAGNSKKALEYYERALNETADIDTAAIAAYKISNYYLNGGQAKKAKRYIDKILEADPDYFLKDIQDSISLASSLADKALFLEASKIAQIVLKTLKKSDDDYESLLKNSGVWLAKTDEKSDAIKLLNRYLSEFAYGNYSDIVTTTKDSLFFDIDDANLTTKLAKYDSLIQTYKNDPIGDKALYKKAELLYESLKYQEILNMKDSLQALETTAYPKVDELIDGSATALMKEKLKNNQCSDVVEISKNYNVKLSSEFDDGLYNCYVALSEFDNAKEIASANISSVVLTQKMKWIYRYATADFKTGNYKEAISAGNDLIKLIEKEKKSPYKDIYRVMFDAYQRVGNDEKMMAMMSKILELFKDDFKDIERYVQMMTLGTRLKDDTVIITYGQKVMDLQTQTSSYSQSPYVEFALYQAYVNKDNMTKAMDVLYALDDRDLSREQRARQKYLLGSLLQKQWRYDEAKEEYKKSIAANKESPWAKLSADAMKLI